MFELETPNIIFNYRAIFSKGCWGQSSPKFIQGHLGSLSVKNNLLLLNFILGLSILLVLSGDIETNPGPPRADISKLSDEIKELKNVQENLIKRIKTLESQNMKLKNDFNRLEDQSRRDNLVFHGIPESSKNESWETNEKLVKDFMSDKMGLNTDERTDEGIQIERAHRINRPNRSGNTSVPRPIIVKFSRYKQRQKIMTKAKDLTSDVGVKIKEDFSGRVRFQRWKLGEVMIKLKEASKQAKLKFDKLEIGSKSFVYDDNNSMFKCLQDKKLYQFDSNALQMTEHGPCPDE